MGRVLISSSSKGAARHIADRMSCTAFLAADVSQMCFLFLQTKWKSGAKVKLEKEEQKSRPPHSHCVLIMNLSSAAHWHIGSHSRLLLFLLLLYPSFTVTACDQSDWNFILRSYHFTDMKSTAVAVYLFNSAFAKQAALLSELDQAPFLDFHCVRCSFHCVGSITSSISIKSTPATLFIDKPTQMSAALLFTLASISSVSSEKFGKFENTHTQPGRYRGKQPTNRDCEIS